MISIPNKILMNQRKTQSIIVRKFLQDIKVTRYFQQYIHKAKVNKVLQRIYKLTVN